MLKKPKVKLDEVLDMQYQIMIAEWKPKFGNPNDIAIRDHMERLALKSTSVAERNELKAKIIYLLS